MDGRGSGAARWLVAVASWRAGLVLAAVAAAMATAGCAGLQQPEVEQVAAAFESERWMRQWRG
jgi:3-hydroxyisobutyrate dehydrogenase-like beta-hydroxyacid dehydrogenase